MGGGLTVMGVPQSIEVLSTSVYKSTLCNACCTIVPYKVRNGCTLMRAWFKKVICKGGRPCPCWIGCWRQCSCCQHRFLEEFQWLKRCRGNQCEMTRWCDFRSQLKNSYISPSLYRRKASWQQFHCSKDSYVKSRRLLQLGIIIYQLEW